MSGAGGLHGLQSFGYAGVTLGAGRFKQQFDDAVAYYLAIPDDSLLNVFRLKADLPGPGRSLAGWYGPAPSIFGQILAAFARMYRSTGDARIKDKALFLAGEWERCADRSPAVLVNDTYCFDKMLGGLLDLHEHLGHERALEYAARLTETAMARFKRNIKRDGLQDGALSSAGMIEWYTLPEHLYRAFQLTGDGRYRSFAEEWDYCYYWDKLISRDPGIGPRHAYSHVNALSSAARAYLVTGDVHYLDAVRNAYELILSGHTFATGGYGPAESLFVEREGYLGDSLKSPWDPSLKKVTYRNFADMMVSRDDTWGSCEVSCCSWAVFKLCNYLLTITGDARYGEWAEKLLYNGVAGQLPLGPGGKVMYYASYFVNGALKSTEDRRLFPGGQGFTWQCCTGTFPQDVAEYCNMLYYHDGDGIYVSQYMPSRVRWVREGIPVTIENVSRYPEEERIIFHVNVERELEFPLRFRVPGWAKGDADVRVNGVPVAMRAPANAWGEIRRGWRPGDVVTITFPWDLRLEPVDRKNRDIVALRHGPLVLATDEMTELVGDAESPGDWIHPAADDPLVFETDPGHVAGYDFITRRFEPYYRIGPMKWYFMYNRIRAE